MGRIQSAEPGLSLGHDADYPAGWIITDHPRGSRRLRSGRMQDHLPDTELFSVGCFDLSHPNRKLSEAGEGFLRDIFIPRSQAEIEVNIHCHWLKTENKPSHQ